MLNPIPIFSAIVSISIALGGCAIPSAPTDPAFIVCDESQRPLLTDGDLVCYDWPTHTMVLRPGVHERLQRMAFAGQSVQFTVFANGQPCYDGHMLSGLSSTSSPGIFIVPTLSFTDDEFSNRITIDLGYPAAWAHKGPDPRGDPRVKAALLKVGKLRDDGGGANPPAKTSRM